MDPLGSLLNIAHLIKRAHQLVTGCATAPDEIRLASDQLHSLTLVFAGVKADLYDNPRSFVHQKTAQAKTRTVALISVLRTCDGALKQMEKLLSKYDGFKKNGHVSIWTSWKHTSEGKKDIADAKVDLMLATMSLDLFMSREHRNVLYPVEHTAEEWKRNIGALELFQSTNHPPNVRRPRAGSNVGRTLIAGLVLTRLLRSLEIYRRRKRLRESRRGTATPNPGPRRIKAVSRVNSGFGQNKQRDKLMHSYATSLVTASSPQPKPQRARTPSPDFYMIGNDPAPPYTPIRRSSSMNRILDQINRKAKQPAPAKEFLACWRVGIGNLAIGLKTAPQFLQHKRGQEPLRKIAAGFQEAKKHGRECLGERDLRVRLLLESKNGDEKRKRSGKTWYFLAGMVVGRDAGRSGMVSVEKAMVILVRR